jgi:hypothetical protein
MEGDLHRIGSVSVWGVSRLNGRRGAWRHGSAASVDCASPMLRQAVANAWLVPCRARGAGVLPGVAWPTHRPAPKTDRNSSGTKGVRNDRAR